MPVAIVGMHRSGTSLVAQMLAKAGLHLGRSEDLIPAGPDNPDGYWEHAGFHRLNEAVLSELGGGWDSPPVVPARWRDDARLRRLAPEAKRLVAELGTNGPWGWKDPRTSITLALWNDLIPDLEVVVVVRNPLEVAFSLNRRGMFSYTTALKLWQTYYERLLEASTPEQRIVTEYAAYFTRPKAELRRIVSFLGIDASPRSLDDAAATRRAELRHMQFDLADLLDAEVAPDIVELYAWLRSQAGARGRATRARAVPPPTPAPSGARVVDESVVEAEALRKQLLELRPGLDMLETRVADLDAELSEALAREAALVREAELLREQVRNQEQLVQQLSDVHESFYTLEASLPESPAADESAAAYTRAVRRIKTIVRSETPPGAAVAVVTKGDERLTGFYGRRGLHFPQTDDGSYAGGHPASGLSAIAHLEVVRARGADYFLLPADYFWWFEHYPELRRHLSARYRQVAWEEDACVLFALREETGAKTRRRRSAVEISSAVRSAIGRPPTVLDWDTGLDLAATLPAIQVSAGTANGRLPYADKSVDIVALTQSTPGAAAEAARVATAAVIAFPADSENGAEPDVHLKIPEIPLAVSGVSIVVPVQGDAPETARCLASLHETLPREFSGEIVLVDDALEDLAAELLNEFAQSHDRTVLARNPTSAGPLESANRGAEAASEETVIFLGPDVLLLPGWLRPLLDTLHEHDDAGAVGGRLLFPDGSLEEAGRTVFSDGSVLRFGYGQTDPEAGLFDYVRRVEHCSRRLLATPRSLFLELGGFDGRFSPEVYGVIDYCLALRDRDLNVYYQPASTCVHLHRRTADSRDPNPAIEARVDQRFARKWKALLEHQPARPEVVDLDALHALAADQA